MTTFTPEQEEKREVFRIAIFAARELRAALEKMGVAWIVELTRADSICESLEASAPIYGTTNGGGRRT